MLSSDTAELGNTSSDPPFPSTPTVDHSTSQTTFPSHTPSDPTPPPTSATDQALATLTRLVENLTIEVLEQRNYVDQRLANELLPITSSVLPESSSYPGLVSSLPPSSSAPPVLSNRAPSATTRNAVPLPKMDAQAEWAYIPPTVFDSVVDGTFEIRDLWKLDPTRRLEIEKMAEDVISDRALNGLSELLQITSAFTEQSRSLTKYRSLDDIILPWIVYCRIREVVQPGSGHYLSAHVIQLYLAFHALNKRFPAVLRYHLDVCQKRMSLGDSVDWSSWITLDLLVLNTSLVQSLPSSSRGSTPSSGAPTTQHSCRRRGRK